MKKKIQKDNRPVIETMINTAALALTASGVVMIQGHDVYGFVCVIFGAGLEYFKYWGRSKNLW